jgi:hypothetical protein
VAGGEKRVALFHRVLVPAEEYPKEYAILVTDRRSIFIRQPKTRSGFVLRAEMRYGTALVTDAAAKTLEDYEHTSLESLMSDGANVTIPHDRVVSFAMGKEVPSFRWRDAFVWLTMRRQGEIFQVYNFAVTYSQDPSGETGIRFYAVPLGAYFKPRRQTQTRETILREYAQSIFETYRSVIPWAVKDASETV